MTTPGTASVSANRATCPICGSAAQPYRFALGAAGELPLHLCPECLLIFASVEHSDRIRHDRSYHAAHEHVEDPVAATLNAAGFLEYWSRELSWSAGTAILDVGCAEGRLIEIGRAMGFRMQGIDVSDYYVDRWKAANLPAEIATAEEYLARHPGSVFDVVVTRQVIEHVRDPLGFMRACRELVRPGGTVIVETADPHRFVSRLQGKQWANWVPQEGLGAHVTFISAATAATLGKRAGARLIESVPAFRYRPRLAHAREQGTSVFDPRTVLKYLFHQSPLTGGWCHRFERTEAS